MSNDADGASASYLQRQEKLPKIILRLFQRFFCITNAVEREPTLLEGPDERE